MIGKRRLSYNKLSAAFLPIVFRPPISVLLSFSMKKKFYVSAFKQCARPFRRASSLSNLA